MVSFELDVAPTVVKLNESTVEPMVDIKYVLLDSIVFISVAPNLIHSLDASLLHLSATQFHAPISLIHDSVLCRATDMTHLSHLVRDTYMHLFAGRDFLREFAQAIGAESEPPIIGDMDFISQVIDSPYFFC